MTTGLGASLCFDGATYGSLSKNGAVSRGSSRQLLPVPTTCGECPNFCSLICYLHEGQIHNIMGNEQHPLSRGKLCARAIAGENLQNDTERVLYPLRRKGPRGAKGGADWERIGWDEALSEISGIAANSSNREFGISMLTGANSLILPGLAAAQKNISLLLEEDFSQLAALQQEMSIYGAPCFPDLEKSKFILNFGANPLTGGDHFPTAAGLLVDRLSRGKLRMVTFDPRLSNTAAKGNWMPIIPGTDGIAALAMAQVILRENLHDQNFIQQHVNISSQALQSYLKDFEPRRVENICGIHHQALEKIAQEFALTKRSLAIIGGGALKNSRGQESKRCLEILNIICGKIDQKGGLIINRQLPWLKSLGLDNLLQSSYEQSSNQYKSYNSFLEHITTKKGKTDLLMVLNANPLYQHPHRWQDLQALAEKERVGRLVVFDTHITETALMADLILPAATWLESWSLKCNQHSNGNTYLNLQQPAAQVMGQTAYLKQLRQKIGNLQFPGTKPRGQSISLDDLLLKMARRIALRSKNSALAALANYKNSRDFLFSLVDSSKELRRHGGMSSLRQKGFIELKAPGQSFKKFPTPDSKIALPLTNKTAPRVLSGYKKLGQEMKSYASSTDIAPGMPTEKTGGQRPSPANSSTMAQAGGAKGRSKKDIRTIKMDNLPFLKDSSLWLKNHQLGKSEAFMVTFRGPLASNQTFNRKWLAEFGRFNPLWINSDFAATLKIKTGDQVVVETNHGKFEVTCRTSQAIIPGVVALAEGFGHSACGKISQATPYKSADPDTHLIWWQKTGNGVNPIQYLTRKQRDLLPGNKVIIRKV